MPEQKRDDKMKAKEVQVVVFRLGVEEYGLDITQVKEIIRLQNITPVPKSPQFIEGVINLRGQVIAVMDISERFNLKKKARTEKARIVITEVKENSLGFIVDEVPEVLRIPESNIEPTPEMFDSQIHHEFIRGVGKVRDRLIILLNVDKILSLEEIKQVSETSKEP